MMLPPSLLRWASPWVWLAALPLAACSGNGGGNPGTPDGGPVGPPVVVNPPILPGGNPDLRAVYPESLLCPLGDDDSRCGPGYDPEQALSPEALQAALNEGLSAWHYVGDGGSCASCHSPDAIELSKVGYADCDIRRRALDHVDMARADQIVGLVHAVRQVYGVDRPLHPDRFRPLQPGYEPLGEVHSDVDAVDTDLQDERDLAFMNLLVNELQLTWATEPITSLEMAHTAYDELLALDLTSLPLGVPFDRLSEDPNAVDNECRSTDGPAHGGRSIFEWMPALATAPSPGNEDSWRALLTAYIEEPSTENLWAYYDRIDELTVCGLDPGLDAEEYSRACEWMRLKYKSLQVFQHMLRHDTRARPDPLIEHRAGGAEVFAGEHLPQAIARNPIWETGDFVRRNPLARDGQNPCFGTAAHPCTFLPPAIDETIHSVPSYEAARRNQGELFQLSWVMMGFVEDPALVRQSDRFETFIGDYLESVLLPRYDIHHAFVFAVMAVRKSAATEWFDAEGFRRGTGKLASVRTFSFKQVRDNTSPPGASSPRYAAHRRMFANFARMFLFLVEEDLRLTGEIFGRSGTYDGSASDRGGVLQAVRFMRDWIEPIEGAQDAAMNALVVSIESLAAEATELRTEDDFSAYEGLQPTHRWGGGETADYRLPYSP